MPRNLTIVSVRLDPRTIRVVDALSKDNAPLLIHRRKGHPKPTFNRSEIIRHALAAGLDVLTGEQPLYL